MKKNSIILATLLALFTLCIFSSCKEKAPIEKKKMSQIVADYYMLDGTSKHELREVKNLDMNLVYVDFLNKHGVTAAVFDSAVSYYAKRPLEFKEIYEDAIKIVNKKLEVLNKELEEN